MEPWIDRFLDYLRVERNSSALTLKSYAEDLFAARDFWTAEAGGPPGLENAKSPIRWRVQRLPRIAYEVAAYIQYWFQGRI